MNIDPGMAADYVMAAAGGFAIGALAGRRLMTEMRTALGAIQMRLSALEQKVIGHSSAASPISAPNGNSAATVQPMTTVAAAQAAALEHHASAVEKLAAAVDKHAQAIDDHGAATVAAAVEMGSHPAPAALAPTFATPLHAVGVMGASVAPAAVAVVAAAPQS